MNTSNCKYSSIVGHDICSLLCNLNQVFSQNHNVSDTTTVYYVPTQQRILQQDVGPIFDKQKGELQ